MECGVCSEAIEEHQGFLHMDCAHYSHLMCFAKENYVHFYHGNLARVHCYTCQEHSFTNEAMIELQNTIHDDDLSDHHEEEMMEEVWNTKPIVKERLKKMREVSKECTKANKAFNSLTKKIVDDLKKETEGSIHVLRGMYKSAYMKLTQSPESKALKSANISYNRIISRLLDDFNTNQWCLRHFLRKKGYSLPYHYRYRPSSYRLRRKFSVKLI